jgi:hypothetical protein
MKTFLEVAAWCAGARKKFPDPATPVTQAFFRYSELASDPSEDLVFNGVGGKLSLWILPGKPVTVSVADTIVIKHGELQAFAADCIHEGPPGIWALRPSLNLPGIIHIFVVLYDVPLFGEAKEPPWKKSLILNEGVRDNVMARIAERRAKRGH